MKLTTGLKIMGAALALAAPAVSHATISLTTGTYSQSFDSLTNVAGTATWVNDVTLPGWVLFRQPDPGTALNPSVIGVDNGGSSTGAFYSYGTTNSTERALGGVGAGTAYFGSPANGQPAGAIGVGFTNNTGHAIGTVTISFDGEQWRNGGNTTAQTMLLQYGVGASFTTVNWITPGGTFNWTSPIATASSGALNGNLPANRVTGVGGTVTALWQPGQTVWIRWIERNDVGNDHGLAIDNFTLTTTPIPEPSSVALFAAGAAFLGAFQIRRRRRDR